jgi:hypothetical protein
MATFAAVRINRRAAAAKLAEKFAAVHQFRYTLVRINRLIANFARTHKAAGRSLSTREDAMAPDLRVHREPLAIFAVSG